VSPNIRLLWSTDTNTSLYSAGTVADINGDGLGEIILAGYNAILAYDGNGKRLWEWAVQPRFSTYPSVLVRAGRPALIYVADNAGNFVCLDGAGKEVWRAKLNAPSNWSAAVVCDLNGDGKHEVVQTDEKGTAWAFDALSGQVIWTTPLQGDIGASPSLGDLNGDGKPEVAVVTEAGWIFILGNDGKILWSRQVGRSLYCAPVIFTASDGSGRVVFGSGDGEVFCFDANGELRWRYSAGSSMDSSVSVGDMDLDGRADIFAVAQEGVIERLDEDGNVMWTLDMHMRTDASGAIADLDGDGRLEYILTTHKARILALNAAGEVVFEQQLKVNNAYNATPTFGDVTKASPGLELVVSGGDQGLLFCFATPAPRDAVVQWGGFRRDLTMAGSWPGLAKSVPVSMTPENLAWDKLLTGQGARFRITNAEPQAAPLRAEASCVTPDGARRSVTGDIHGAAGKLALPLDVLAPGVYSFSWSLRTVEGRVLASGARAVTLQPFVNDRSLVVNAAAEMRAVADAAQATLPLSAAALVRDARLLDDTARIVAPLQDAALAGDAAARQRAVAETSALVACALRGQRMAGIVKQAVAIGPGTSVLAFAPPMWESLGVSGLLPERAATSLDLTRRVVPGEHQPVAVNLLNVTNRELEVRVVIEAPPGIAVVPMLARSVPTSDGMMSWDALPELDNSSVIPVPSFEVRQLWLDVAVGAVQPGDHAVKVRLQAINGAGVLEEPKSEHAVAPPEAVVTIALKALPFEMAAPSALRLCTWAYVETSLYKDIADATYANLFAHGNNVWTIGALPAAQYDDQGRLVGPVDYGKFDAAVERWRGKDVVLLLSGFPALTPASGKDGYDTPPYRKALKPYLDDIVEHMARLGFDLDHWAFYPIDEAGGTGWDSIDAQARFGELMRAARPEVKIYADAGGPDPAMIKKIAPYVDIWSPGVNMVATEPDKFSIMQATGKTLWSYNCSYNNYNKPTDEGRTLKAADVVAEYRIAGIFAFRHGLTGLGFWTSISNPEDPWARARYEYPMLYTGRTAPVTSRRWEAVREGIEDFRILTALKARLDARTAPPLSNDARAKVKRLLEVSVPQYIDGVTDEAGLDRLRGEIMDCVEACAK
jgi:outer membrane protein assembly factor BamB